MTFKTFSAKLELIPESHSVGEEDAVEVVGLVLEDESLDGAPRLFKPTTVLLFRLSPAWNRHTAAYTRKYSMPFGASR